MTFLARPVWAFSKLPRSLSVNVCTYHFDLEILVFLVSSIPCVYNTLLTSFSAGFIEPWSEESDGKQGGVYETFKREEKEEKVPVIIL